MASGNKEMTAKKPAWKPITQPNKGSASSSIKGGKTGRYETMGPTHQASAVASRNK